MFTKKKVAIILFIMFFLYVIQPNIFERFFFFNEMFSLLGLLIFLYKPVVWRKNDKVHNLVMIFLGYVLLHLIISIFRLTNWYAYFRHTAIFYSVFSFFTGLFLYDYRLQIFKLFDKWLRKITLLVGLIPNIFDRAFYSVGIAFFRFSNNYSKFLIALIFVNLYVAAVYKVATPGFIIILLVSLLIFKRYIYFKIFIIGCFVMFAIFYIYFIPNFALVTKPEGFRGVIYSHPVLQIDHNTTFRFGLWYEIIFIDFWKNITGIGFGTQLFKYTSMPVENGPIAYYVSGAHNTFITLFGRLGLPAIFFFLILYNYIFKFYYKFKNEIFNNKSILFFIAFFSITCVGFFNLVIESPILASGYWMILGLVNGEINRINKEKLHEVKIPME